MSKKAFEVAGSVEVTQGAPKLTVHSLEDGVVIVAGKAGVWKMAPVGIRNSELPLGFENLGAALGRTWDVAVFVVEMVGPACFYWLRRHFRFGLSEKLTWARR